MSKANASAKSRRAFPQSQSLPTSQPPAPVATQQSQQTGLTLPQVVSLIDKRLIQLETFMKETKESTGKKVTFEDTSVTLPSYESETNLSKVIDEFNTRFDIFAEEISNLKDIVLKLQSYTMEVNKTLMEERINVFSDLGQNNNADVFSMNVENLTTEEAEVLDTLTDLKNSVEEELSTIQ
jgi:hypothetical protein